MLAKYKYYANKEIDLQGGVALYLIIKSKIKIKIEQLINKILSCVL
ncbi:hypothetical protein HMPREF1982_01778 [Clostridiales bacterium oral taxon 876 str. F0540]|nr:hypothetical protein HMPREF1982_01778 [Clostridiales bacterium oral taxon 876 str. F0540]